MMEDVHPTIPAAAQEIPIDLHRSDPSPSVSEQVSIDLHLSDPPTTPQASSIFTYVADAAPIIDHYPSLRVPIFEDSVSVDEVRSNLSSGAHTFEDSISTDNFRSEKVFMHDVQEQAWYRLEYDYANRSNNIHRFPVSLLEFSEERQYIAPKVVAIGPYYRHLLELKEMEEVKKAAAYLLCKGIPEEVYKKVVAVAGDARRCYDAGTLEGISEAAFASMMFHDACFLMLTVHAITNPGECAPPLLRRISASKPIVLRDIFLLENQIPWIVLQAVLTFGKVDLSLFIATMGMDVQSRIDRQARPLELRNHTPPHLLGLFHFYQSGHAITHAKPRTPFHPIDSPPPPPPYDPEILPPSSRRLDVIPVDAPCGHEISQPARSRRVALESLPLGTSAIELAEIGIKLKPSKTAELKDIGLQEGILFPEIFLPSLHLNENTACWLLNMAAFETCTASDEGHYTVSSYLALFAMLMDREEDVHELRAKHLIHGEFTNKQTLDFFKDRHASNLLPGHHFFAILRRLERYKRKRRLWIAIHRFVYINIKTIITVLSIISVLVAIFKTLLSLKKHSS